MRQNRVKKLMREGKLALGGYVRFADPQIIEIIGLAGFDAAFIDMEHTDWDIPLVCEMIRASELAGVTSIVRVPDIQPKRIMRLLDMGAEGIYIPHIAGIEGARQAVAAVRYPPLGHRGASGASRASRFGTIPWKEHVRSSNEEILLGVMCEDEQGINDIEQIAALDGIDLVAIGPSDFAEYMGVRDSPNANAPMRARFLELAGRVKAIGKAKLAVPIAHPTLSFTAQEVVEMGGGYCNVQPQPAAVLLRSMRERVENIHKAVGQS